MSEVDSKEISRFFPVPLRVLPVESPLPFDLFLFIQGKPILFKNKGELLTTKRYQSLRDKSVNELFIAVEEQRDLTLFFLEKIESKKGTPSEIDWFYHRQAGLLIAQQLHAPETEEKALPLAQTYSKNNFFERDQQGWERCKRAMANVVHEQYAINHAVNVSLLAGELWTRIHGVTDEGVWEARLAGLVHDIGEREMSAEIINEEENSRPQDLIEIRNHPLKGVHLLEQWGVLPPRVKHAVLAHHENLDGSGYPFGIKADEIQMMARIISLCDVYDALTSQRPNRVKLEKNAALEMMDKIKAGRFDPTLLVIFRKMVSP